MSVSQLRVAAYNLEEHYGEIVRDVGLCLLKKGVMTVVSLKRETTLSLVKIKKALTVLIQHNLVKFEKNARKQVVYSGQLQNILGIIQYAQYTYCAKELFGDAAELIITELLQHGSLSMTKVVQSVTQRMLDPALMQSEQVDHRFIASRFEELVEAHLVKRVVKDFPAPQPDINTTGIATPGVVENTDYKLPTEYMSGKRKCGSSSGGPATKRQRKMEECFTIDFQDEAILWHVNCIQFHHHLVNKMIENAVKSRIDEFAADIIKVMLKSSMLSRDTYEPQTKPVSIYDISKSLPNSYNVDDRQISKCLNLMQDDKNNFVSKTGEHCGGMYAVNIKKSVEAICTQTIESVVRERCGSKSLRIFRLLMMKEQLEQKQVEEMIMVPSKEAKELLYNLLSEDFAALQEIPRAADYAPSRTFYLFSVNIPHVCRMLLDRSYKTVGNLISRRQHEMKENKRLVEKAEKIEATIMTLKGQGMDDDSSAIQELEEMMTTQEKQQLAKLKVIQSKLEQAELLVNDTVLVFTQYLALRM